MVHYSFSYHYLFPLAYISRSHFQVFPMVYSHFVNSHFVNIDQMGIDKVGIDKVGIDKVGIDKVGRYLPHLQL